MQRFRWVLIGVVAAATFAGQAHAATTVGQIFIGEESCASGYTWLQTTSPISAYTAPHAGVITSWSHLAGADAGELRLKVGRGSGDDLEIVGQSDLEMLTPDELNTFPTRVPVAAGDVIGFYFPSNVYCLGTAGGFGYHFAEFDILPGAAASWLGVADNDRLNISARLEPDADGDGFGDETQDQCPTNATTQGACPPDTTPRDTTPPETTITKQPPNKLTRSQAKFKFTSNEAGSTFECKADRKPFKACTSPMTVKRLADGKHKFKVRAIDAAGNVDPRPAKDKFRVVD